MPLRSQSIHLDNPQAIYPIELFTAARIKSQTMVPRSRSRAMPIQEHIQQHMLIGRIPPLDGWVYASFPHIKDEVVAHIRRKVGQDKVLSVTVRIWNRDISWLAVVGVVLLENISRNWIALNEQITRIIRTMVRQLLPTLVQGRVAVTYQLFPRRRPSVLSV
jgi:hypothetical protein